MGRVVLSAGPFSTARLAIYTSPTCLRELLRGRRDGVRRARAGTAWTVDVRGAHQHGGDRLRSGVLSLAWSVPAWRS